MIKENAKAIETIFYDTFKDQKSVNAVRHQLGDLSRKIDAVVQPVYISQKI